MLSRRGFFGVAAGAAAVAAGGAAVAAPAAFTGIDRAVGADRTDIVVLANHLTEAGIQGPFVVLMSPAAYASITRGRMSPNDLTREQLAANLPVIGKDSLPAEKAPRGKALARECNKPVPAKESFKAYLKRMSLPCPGRLE